MSANQHIQGGKGCCKERGPTCDNRHLFNLDEREICQLTERWKRSPPVRKISKNRREAKEERRDCRSALSVPPENAHKAKRGPVHVTSASEGNCLPAGNFRELWWLEGTWDVKISALPHPSHLRWPDLHREALEIMLGNASKKNFFFNFKKRGWDFLDYLELLRSCDACWMMLIDGEKKPYFHELHFLFLLVL